VWYSVSVLSEDVGSCVDKAVVVMLYLGGMAAAQWEDITGANPLTLINDCVQFTTNISARYRLPVHCILYRTYAACLCNMQCFQVALKDISRAFRHCEARLK